MLSKAHLTSHSRMSGSRWVITPSWLSGSWRSFLGPLEPARLFSPWDSPGKTTGMSCHSFLQEIFLTQGSNPVLLYSKQILYHLSYQRSPRVKLSICIITIDCIKGNYLNGKSIWKYGDVSISYWYLLSLIFIVKECMHLWSYRYLYITIKFQHPQQLDCLSVPL